MPVPHHSVFTGHILFLSPKHRRQSTEMKAWNVAVTDIKITSSFMAPGLGKGTVFLSVHCVNVPDISFTLHRTAGLVSEKTFLRLGIMLVIHPAIWPQQTSAENWGRGEMCPIGARRELMDFMVQGKINRGRHTDHLAGRHSNQTNQCPPPPSPHIFLPNVAIMYKCTALAEMGDHFATIDMGRQEWELLCPFRVGELGPHLTQCGLG